tara:strand:+ start:651 stop:860 length:210 start_codon:yes stop_codon:yes gene_type:complete
MNWETVAYIGIYAVLCLLAVGISVYGCVKGHVQAAGTEYERLVSEEPVEMEDIKDRIVPYPHEDVITNL